MKRIKCLIPATMMVLLSGCGYFGGDEKQQLEQAWLAQDHSCSKWLSKFVPMA